MRALLDRGRSCRPLTSADSPSVSDSRMNSCRSAVHILPTAVMNSMPLIHSAGVRFTSRAKACRCFTAAAITSLHARVGRGRHLLEDGVGDRLRRQLPHACLPLSHGF